MSSPSILLSQFCSFHAAVVSISRLSLQPLFHAMVRSSHLLLQRGQWCFHWSPAPNLFSFSSPFTVESDMLLWQRSNHATTPISKMKTDFSWFPLQPHKLHNLPLLASCTASLTPDNANGLILSFSPPILLLPPLSPSHLVWAPDMETTAPHAPNILSLPTSLISSQTLSCSAYPCPAPNPLPAGNWLCSCRSIPSFSFALETIT